LSKNGVEITPDFVKGLLQLTETFKPKFPPQNTKEKKEKKN